MDTSTLDFNTLTLLAAILGSTMASTLTIITLMFRQSNRHEDNIKSVNANVAALGTTVAVLDTKVDALDGKVDALDKKVDVMGRDVSDARERLARVESHLTAREGFQAGGLQLSAPVDPPPDDPGPGTGERAAG